MFEQVSRRQFIKIGAVGAALAGAGTAGMLSFGGLLEADAESNELDEHIAYTFHQSHCCGNCSLKCTVREGRLVLIEPNDIYKDKRYSICCVRGLSELQHIYSPERVKTPLRRVGERGSGEFKQITWDEALDEIMEVLESTWSKYGKESVGTNFSGETKMGNLPALLGCQGGGRSGIDMGVGNGFDPAIGGFGFAFSTAGSRDWVNSKYVFHVGTNYLESAIAQSVPFFEAKDAGAEIITVDPHFSSTAAKSHQWVPIEPGTDAALFLGMMSEIIEAKTYDEEFMKVYTTFPFLISKKDGKLLQLSAEETPEEEPIAAPGSGGMPVQAPPPDYLVWDEKTNSPLPFSTKDIEPALSGTHTIDGETYCTVFDTFLEIQADYPVSWASKITTISEDTIRSLARKYAEGPSALSLGYGGNDKFSNADVSGHAAAVMVGLTGNVGKPGASAGAYYGGQEHSFMLPSMRLPAEISTLPAEVATYDLPKLENSIRVFLFSGNGLQQKFANMNQTVDWIRTLDFVVGFDVYDSPTLQYSDIVLPVCSKFENEEAIGGIVAAYNCVRLREKVIEPLFEAKTDFQIEKEFAKRLGLDQYLPESAEAAVRYSIENSTLDVTLEELIEHQGAMELPGAEEARVGFTDYVFSTPTTKFEVYYESLVQDKQALPTWEPPSEAYADNPLKDSYPLQFHQGRSCFYIHNQFMDAEWIRQHYVPVLEMNQIDLKSRGIESGDVVEVFNGRGSLTCKAQHNEAIRPGSIRYFEGARTKDMIKGNLQMLTNDTMLERGVRLTNGPVIPFYDTLVEVKKAAEQTGGAR